MMSEKRLVELPIDYAAILAGLKDQIRTARLKAGLAVNRELVLLYWRIGRQILRQQQEGGWGSKVIGRLAQDLLKEFPEMKGLSPRNLKYIRAFAEGYPEELIVQQAAAQIPWFHNCVILDKMKNPVARDFYIRSTISHGWSRNILVHQIESGLYERQGQALVNFDRTLPAPQSELAKQILKDPSNFDFLTLGNEAQEQGLESALLDHLQEFLLELEAIVKRGT
jgi:predicted nuclease of restriction endonuclease-like (RecB) superfamily